MKSLSFKITISLIFICSICNHQISYGSELNYSADTSYSTPTSGQITDSYINVSNQGSDSIDVTWRVISNTLDTKWFLQFCDFSECSTNEFSPLPTERSGTLEPGYNDDWYLGIDLNGEPLSEAVWQIEIEYGTNKDTLTWIVKEETSDNNFTSMSYASDTAYLKPNDGQIVDSYIRIQNNDNEPIDIEWRVIESTLNDDMFLQFCDFFECTTNEFSPLPNSRAGTLDGGYSDDWYLGVDPNGLEVEDAVWSIEIDYLDYDNLDTLTWVVTMNPPTSTNVKEHSNQQKISLYPNPATTQLNVKRNTGENTPYRILDLTGKMITNGYLNSDNDLIDVAGLSNGIYLLEIQSNDHKELNKFIKQ